MENKKFLKNDSGSALVYTVVILFIFSMVMISLLAYATSQIRVTRNTIFREQALQIAEAGVNYYQWRLAHFPSDYYDGNASSTSPGPYVHTYTDTDTGKVLGTYSITVTPPAVGSTIATIQSTGWTSEYPNQKRTVTVRYGIPSLAQYAFLTNGDAWIGSTESISGRFFSNGGVRFDGTGNALIQSARTTYTCQGWSGSPCPAVRNGIWGSAPSSTQAFWQFPAPNVDFSSMTSDLATMKTSAQNGGLYLPPSSAQGYSLVFRNNGTIDVYRVTSLYNDPNGTDVNGVVHSENIDYQNRSFQYNIAIPTNGVIYIEDTTWVEGVVRGRALVAAARLPYNPATAPSIIIQNNLTYYLKDGTNSLGLIGQKDILIGYLAPNNLEINAAMIAQNGSAQRWYFPSNTKSSITIYGAVASFGTWTWSWVSGSNCVSGYCNTSTVYDSNLLYSPPPSFPLSSSGYQQISWSSN